MGAEAERPLWDVLTGGSSPAELPARWSAMLDAAQRTDGPRCTLDIPRTCLRSTAPLCT